MASGSSGTAAQAASLQSSGSVTSFTVVDTAANIAASFGALNLDTKISSITVSPKATLALTYAQFASDGFALGKLATGTAISVSAVPVTGAAAVQANAMVVSFTLTDSSANVAAALATLAADTKLTAITLSGGTSLAVTYSQYTTYATVLALLATADTLVVSAVPAASAKTVQAATKVSAFSVADSSANIVANLAALAVDTKLSSIVLTGGTTLAVTGSQYSTYTTTVDKLASGNTLTVSAATASIASALQADAHVGTFTITDTGANIISASSALVADTKLGSITLSGTTSITVTYAQYAAGLKALDKLVSGDTMVVTGVSAAKAASVGGDTKVQALTVSDSLANIGTSLDALQTLVASGKVTAIAVADTGQNLAITPAQSTADAAALKLMTGAFTVTRPVINLIWDASVASAPAGFVGAVQDAANYLDALITSPITVNIAIGYGEYNGIPLPASTLGETVILNSVSMTTTQFKSYLSALPTSATLTSAIASLTTAGEPTTLTIASAEAKALGAVSGYGTQIDAAVGFETDPTGRLFTYDPNNRGVLGQVDLIAVAEHELSHALGRLDLTGASTALDLYRFSAAGKVAAPGTTSYFSINGGTTNLDNFATTGDTADWAPSAGNDANNAILNTGSVDVFTAVDVTELAALGFTTAGTVPSSTATIPAYAAGGLNAATLTFIGTPIALTMGTSTIAASVAIPPAGGIEEINNFIYGTDKLSVNLADLSGTLQAFDTMIGTVHAVALTGSNDLTHGLVFAGMSVANTAANLMSSHITIAGTTATIT